MRIAIIQFPGSNCERETMLAVKRAGMEPIEFLWNEPKEKLQMMDGYIIVGGFSYEDRSRAGIIAALDPVIDEIKQQSEKGKPVLGICNGAQILVEAGLVPGLENHKVGMVLTENKRIVNNKVIGTGFYNAWVNMRLSDQYQRNAFTRTLTPKNILSIPVAHGEGRFAMSDMLLQEIETQGLHVFQYCDEAGRVIDEFPVNPNGSLRNIAAISNKAGNVMAIMPHPERTTEGDPLFQSMRQYLEEWHAKGVHESAVPLYYYPRQVPKRPLYQDIKQGRECVIQLMITDNHALTVQHTLHQLGMPVTVMRQLHWEVQCESDALFEQIKQSGVLYNERKEFAVREQTHSSGMSYLVRPKEDLIGQQKLQMLQDHFSLTGVQAIKHAVLWHFSSETANIADLVEKIFHTNIIFNPYAHECYQYRSSRA